MSLSKANAVVSSTSANPTRKERGAALGLRVHRTTVAGARTTYLDEGEGPTILLLHGAPLTSLGFVRVIHELKKAYRVVAPDLPGFGESELPAGFQGTLGEYADFVVEFCRSLGLRDLTMYVNDSSGCIGLAAATRSRSLAAAMIVADTVPIPLTGAAWLVGFVLRYVISSRIVRFLNRRLNLLAWLVASVAPWLRPFGSEERQALVREFGTAEKRERILDLFEQMGSDRAFMESTAALVAERLADMPVLILYGQLDPMRLAGGVRRFRKMFARSSVAIVPKEEHFPILASGRDVARRVREWLVGVASGPPKDRATEDHLA